MSSLVIYKQRVSEWETSNYRLISYPTNSVSSLEASFAKNNIELVCAEPVNRSYSKQELTEMLRKFVAAMSKQITREIIEGRKQLPELKDLPKTSRNICTVVMNRGSNLYLSLPIHCYHAWRSLEDNNKDDEFKRIISTMYPGKLFIRLPTLQELESNVFIHHEAVGKLVVCGEYANKITTLLSGTIYGNMCSHK